ncbi:MAG: hypothetical protein ACLU8W_10990 [Clostridia bacterium]
MKVKLKPWQIGLIAAAGVVVLGGVGIGIYFGVNRSIDDKVKEQVDAAIESMYSSEAALDESETPTQAAISDEPQTNKESTTPQTSKEPETVLVYLEPTTEEPITWELDPVLSEEVSKLMSEKFPNAIWDKSINSPAGPENFIKNNRVSEANYVYGFIGKAGNNTAPEIANAWTECAIRDGDSFTILVYRYHGPGEGYIFAAVR